MGKRRAMKIRCAAILAMILAVSSPLTTLAALLEEAPADEILITDISDEDIPQIIREDELIQDDKAVSEDYEAAGDPDVSMPQEETDDQAFMWNDVSDDPEEFTEDKVQESLMLLGEYFKTGGDPLEILSVTIGNAIPFLYGLDVKKSKDELMMEKMDLMLRNQSEMIGQLGKLNENVVKSELASNINKAFDIQRTGEIPRNYKTILPIILGEKVDETLDYSKMTEAKREEILNNKLIYSFTGATDGTQPLDTTYPFDDMIMTMGSYLSDNQVVTYEKKHDSLFGIYEMLCRYNYHWEHKAYDDLMSFRNVAYSQYWMGASMDMMSLTARINARQNWKGAKDKDAGTLIAQKKMLWEQMQNVKKNYDSTKVVRLSDSVRHYWYPGGNECLFFTEAHEQKVPEEEQKEDYGTGDDFPHGRTKSEEDAGMVHGVTWKYYGKRPLDSKKYYLADKVNADFWMPYTHYKSGNDYYKCPGAEWFEKVLKEDYQGKQGYDIYKILFDKNEGGLTPPAGSSSSWRFMINPDSDHKLVYDQYGPRADRINMPLVKSDGTVDSGGLNKSGVDFYMYHWSSSEVDTDYIGNGYKVIGIGIADHDPNPPEELSPGQLEEQRQKINDIWENVSKIHSVKPAAIISLPEDIAMKEWVKGSSAGLDFILVNDSSDAPEGYPRSVSVDGSSLDPACYEETSDEGRIRVSLNAGYLESLSAGNHSMTAEFNHGFSGYLDENAQDPSITIPFEVRQNGLTIYKNEDGRYVGCNPGYLYAGDVMSVNAIDISGHDVQVTWKSSDEKVATVDDTGKVTCIAGGQATITAMGIDTEALASFDLTVTAVPKGLVINADRKELLVGEKINLTVSCEPEDMPAGFIWSVRGSDEKEATVGIEVSEDTGSAVVTGMKDGTSVISVCIPGREDVKAEISINVTSTGKDFTIAGKKGAKAVPIGKTLPMAVTWTDGRPKNTKIDWTVRNTDGSALISSSGVLKGTGEGKVIVEAVSKADPTRTASAEIYVYVPVKKVTLNTASGIVSKAENANGLELKADIVTASDKPATGVTAGDEPTVEYSMDPAFEDDIDIIASGNTAVIRAKAASSVKKNIPVRVTVRAFNNYEKTLICKVSIAGSNPLKGMKLSKSSMSLYRGDSAKLDAVLKPQNPDGDMGVKWTSSNPDVVYVDDMGNIEARSTGDAVITAVTNASIIKNKKNVPLQATCKIKVKPAIELKITTKDEKEVAVGKQLSVKTKWLNGKPKNTGLIWSVRNVDGEAVINEKGVLTGVKTGKVMVKVVSRSDSRLVSVIFLNITDK